MIKISAWLAVTVQLIGMNALLVGSMLGFPSPAVQQTVEPTPGAPRMVPTPDRLARPTLPAQPTQADLGSQVYYMVCMACHGDQGQGLTPEWVEAWGLGKNTCWQSKCHAANHPTDGFKLPKTIPAVVSPDIPAQFATALDLYNFIKAKMPWQAPGSLKDEEYWQLTAYLARANGADPGLAPLDPQRAAVFHLRPRPPTAATSLHIRVNPWLLPLGVLAAMLFVLALLQINYRFK